MVEAEEKPAMCHICGTTFSSKEELFRHAQFDHAGIPAGKADNISY
jgi:hypothetical protein